MGDHFNSLDDFLESAISKDSNVRLDIFARLEEYLRNEHNHLHSSDLSKFCEAILSWINSSNFKISINGLTILQLLMQRLTEPMRNYSTEIATVILDRLADSKEQVRYASKNLLLFMMSCYTPNFIWDKLMMAFNHKLPKIREEILDLLRETFHKFGASNLPITKLLTHMAKLLGDQNQVVRDKSLETILEMYKYVGEKLRPELRKRQIPDAKLKLILNKCDDILRNGEIKEEAKNLTNINVSSQSNTTSESTTTTANNSSCASLPPTMSKSSAKALPNSKPGNSAAGKEAGGKSDGTLSEEVFFEGFENVTKISLFSLQDLQERLKKVLQTLGNTNPDMIQFRMDAVPMLRSLLIACRDNDKFMSEYLAHIKQLNEPLKLQLKDARSSVVRQVSQTVSLWAETWHEEIDVYIEAWIPAFAIFLPSSIKVMSSNAQLVIRFLFQSCRSSRLIACIMDGMAHKNAPVRRHLCEMLILVLDEWDQELYDKQAKQLINSIKSVITDPDPEARQFARHAYWQFQTKYPDLAKSIVSKFDAKTIKVLEESSVGVFGTMVRLEGGAAPAPSAFSKKPTQPPVAVPSSSKSLKRSTSTSDIKRSNSALSSSRIPIGGVVPLANTLRTTNTTPLVSRIPTSSANPSPKSRVALSQPGSRSTSPTPKYSYLTHASTTNNATGAYSPTNTTASTNPYSFMNTSNSNQFDFNTHDFLGAKQNQSATPTKLNSIYSQRAANSSGGATTGARSRLATSSRNSSRESSPGRRSNYGDRHTSINKASSRNLLSRQISNTPDYERVFKSKLGRTTKRWDDSDEASETSSICSERSFSSSIGGIRVTEDMNEAITFLSSTQWSERRDGLENIKGMMDKGRTFNRQELKRLCEIFGRLFGDQHTKVFSLFLDVLNTFIAVYREHLRDWLFVLLTRLLMKQGSENLSTVNRKILMCLETVRTSFALDIQLKTLLTFVKDNSMQTCNYKVKIAVLNYLQVLFTHMKSEDVRVSDDLKYAVCRIMTMTADPKYVDVRRTATATFVALYNLNAPECTFLLQQLPKNIYQAAMDLLHTHLKSVDSEASPKSKAFTNSFNIEYMSKASYLNDYVNNIGNVSEGSSANSGAQFSHVIKDIENLNLNSNYHYNKLSKNDEILSKDSGVQSNGDIDSDSDGAMTTSSTTSNSTALPLPNLNGIVAVLSNNALPLSSADKYRAMKELTELIKAGNRPECKWNENFKTVLFCLFNHLDQSVTNSAVTSNNEDTTGLAVQTLQALRELLQFQYKEFANYIELTLMKLIDKYRDQAPCELSKLVEECIYTAARCLPPEPCARVLKPLIESADYPKNLIAIKMLQKTIQQMSVDVCNRLKGDLIKSLLISWDNKDSPVRRQSVLCIVDIYLLVGDNLKEHLTQLSSSKMKLLNVYINRRYEEGADLATTIKTQRQQQQV